MSNCTLPVSACQPALALGVFKHRICQPLLSTHQQDPRFCPHKLLDMSLHVPGFFASSSSLDLPQLVESRTVLSESITFETLPTACSEDVPPFPAGHSPPLATVIGLWSRLSLFPITSRKPPKFENRPYVTAPTSPRLKTMLDERICVKRWAVRVHLTIAFGLGGDLLNSKTS
jgi:hypothetical protein